MDIIHWDSAFLNAKLEKVEYWIDPTSFDVWVFAEVVIGFE
jgi:hypothetical protein